MERNRKKRQEQEAEEQKRLNEALSEFRETFEDTSVRPNKQFIRGDIVNAPKTAAPVKPSPMAAVAFGLKPASGPPTLPKSGLSNSALEQAKKLAQERAKKFMEAAARGSHGSGGGSHSGSGAHGNSSSSSGGHSAPRPNRPPKPGANGKQVGKGKSNLEEFREELKMLQEAREQRRGLRQQLQQQLGVDDHAINKIVPLDTYPTGGTGEFDNDPFTTNLYLSNLPLNIEMEDLFKTFGTYGPMASAKILYPRADEERRREYLCGFVAYMSRTDAERAMSAMQRYTLKGNDIKVSFAKPVNLPPQPFYVPPALAEFIVPDPPTGLPFNAKPDAEDLKSFLKKYNSLPPLNVNLALPPELLEDYFKMISRAVVRVVIPTERPLLILIHRTIEFVVRNGPEFERQLVQREHGNPIFRFLYELHHPAHVYYRWKLFSILQGDTPNKWRTERFRMFKDGSWWDPPPMENLLLAMPTTLYHTAFRQPVDLMALQRKEERTERRRHRSEERTEEVKRSRRGELTRSEEKELEELLYDLKPEKKSIAEAMVWCIEHAECAKEIVECIYGTLMERGAPLHRTISRLYLVADIIANSAANVRGAFYYRQYFQERMLSICTVLHSVHSQIEARMKAEQFKQRVMLCFRVWEDNSVYPSTELIKMQNVFLGLYKESDYTEGRTARSSVDDEEDIDGAPLPENEDIDGVPLDDEDIADVFRSKGKEEKPAQVQPEAQKPSVSSKWDALDEDIDGVPMDEDSGAGAEPSAEDSLVTKEDQRRVLLRDIELKVVRYQEELEAENSPNIHGLVSVYRSKLLREMEEQLADSSMSPMVDESPRRAKDRKKRSSSRSRPRRSRSRSRSRSPRRRSRSRDRDRRGHSKRCLLTQETENYSL
uniref:U2 snRNP-associated SURP motif-containing protein n=1 Tax=Steinernema glaseri TaxID=37863 RepID=A0A1I8A1I4_9BILA